MSNQNGPPEPWQPPNARNTPNAERYLLEADALRRRQLRSALLHGSSRTWREQRRVWPAAIAGIVVVSVVLAAFKVAIAVKENEPPATTVPTSGVSTSTGPAPSGGQVSTPGQTDPTSGIRSSDQ